MGALHGGDGVAEFGAGGGAVFDSGQLPGANGGFGRGIERSTGGCTPVIEEAREISSNNSGETWTGSCCGCGSSVRTHRRTPCAEDAVFAVDFAEHGCFGLCGLCVAGGAELEFERGAEDVFVTEDVHGGGRLREGWRKSKREQ